ncbi:MAG TPA: response regulator transcription factor [Candidatus Acidoferrum sp.]|nr:response regulator transcription factor [Candidatus Acidoferrum sp.]
MRALIVEDDHKIASFVVTGLRQAGFAVDHARDGRRGLSLALAEPYDVDVVDLMLPELDGLALIDTLRNRGMSTPVIILTAKRSVDDRVKGLNAGGDDYLTKPFAFSELLARIHALLRRAHGLTAPTRFVAGDLTLDLLRREVRRGGRSIDLQPREFALLECLMRHRGQPLSKTLILRHVWNYDFDPQTNVVEVLVSRLRAKIDGDFDRKMLHTLRGVGYALAVP